MELLLVLSIVLVLGGFALHGVTRQSQNHYMDSLQGTFMTLLLNARNAAVINQVAVIVCPIRTQRQDMSDQLRCGKRNNWHHGVMAFTDRNGNRLLDADDKVVTELLALPMRRSAGAPFAIVPISASPPKDSRIGRMATFCSVITTRDHNSRAASP